MNKSYIIYGIAFILLIAIFLNDEPKVKTNYTKLYTESMFLEDDVKVKSTKNAYVDNQSLKDKIKLVFFGYTSCPDFCPDTLARASRIFKKLNKINWNLFYKIKLIYI